MRQYFRMTAMLSLIVVCFALSAMNYSSGNVSDNKIFNADFDEGRFSPNDREPDAYRLFAEFFVQNYKSQTFDAIPKKFSPEMLQKAPVDKFISFISGVRGGLGDIQSYEFLELKDNGTAIYQLSHGRLRSLLQFSLNGEGLVTGLRIVPAPPMSNGTSNTPADNKQQGAASKPFTLQLQPIRSASDFRSVLEKVRAEYSLPALGAVVLTSSGIQYMEAVGVRSLTTRQPVKLSSDQFHIGSNGKAITGFLAARMVEAGAITWKTKVLDVFPEFRANAHAGYANTTFQDVLSHRAGIQPLTTARPGDSIPGMDFSTTTSSRQKRFELTRWLLMQSPKRDSGAAFTYSNAGYAIAAAMMEKASGKSWESLLESNIWKPLGINATIGWAFANDTTQPIGHLAQASGYIPQPLKYQLPSALDPAGNISLSLPEYSKFVQAHLNGLQGNAQLLRAETYQFLHKAMPAYAIGWGTKQDSVYGFVSSHNGSAGTFLCHTSILPERNLAIVIVSNAAGAQGREAVNVLREHLLSSVIDGAKETK